MFFWWVESIILPFLSKEKNYVYLNFMSVVIAFFFLAEFFYFSCVLPLTR